MLAMVAEQTGYPPELLDLDLDLEADLGIDTVKQAEVFASIREAYGIERDDALKLRDYPDAGPRGRVRARPRAGTVAAAGRRRAGAAPVAGAGRALRWLASASEGEVQARVLAMVAEQTGYPPELLDLDLDLEADLGIDTVKQAELFATIREAYGIERDDSLKLRDYPTLEPRRRVRPRPRAGSREPPAAPGRACAGRRRRSAAPRRWRGRDGGEVRRGCWRWWLSRRVIRRSCWTWIWIWRRIWGSTRSSRRSCSRRFGRRMGSSGMTSLKLRDYPDVGPVVAFVLDRAAVAQPAVAAPADAGGTR